MQGSLDFTAPSGGTTVNWGSINGSMGDQADLEAALAAKLGVAGGTMTGPLVVNLPSASGKPLSAQVAGVEKAYIRHDGLIHTDFGLEFQNFYNIGGGLVGYNGVNLGFPGGFDSMTLVGGIQLGSASIVGYTTTNPEGAFTAPPGSLLLRLNGSLGEVWFKVSGSGNTGWKRIWPQAITTASYGANQTLTADQCYGSVIYLTASMTLTLPAIADGMSLTVITIGAHTSHVKPNASDKLWLNGVALDDGDKATSPGATGDAITLTYYSADGWVAQSNAWTDGGT